MFGSPLHWVYFLYFTVHAHEDRHGTGLLYQMGDTGSIPKGSKGLVCEKCDVIILAPFMDPNRRRRQRRIDLVFGISLFLGIKSRSVAHCAVMRYAVR